MHSGNTKNVTVDVLDQDSATVDVTGGSASMVFAARRGGAPLFTKVGTLPGSPINRLQFTIDPADTEALEGAYHWEAEFIDTSGRVSTVAYGTATVIANSV